MATSEARPAKRRKAKPKAAQKEAKARAEAPADKPKSIFLFADGTGNSSGKLFKTNVWRMYEAIDFGAASKQRKHIQVGYYDNGVGTSAFRPLALLGGIFGIGLHSNVLRLYTFLCRNYCHRDGNRTRDPDRKPDRIYMFGFSRGAYTVRLLADFMSHQGIIEAPEEELSYRVRRAYREYRRVFKPNLPFGRLLVFLGRGIRDEFVGFADKNVVAWRYLWAKPQIARTDRHLADIDFVGVWDTVAAYGGPFAEFTRGIDDWLFPLTMPDYHLNPNVKKARHALSLDDERDAFWPLLWDEVYEQKLIDGGIVDADRLRQVWFAGVHSDVGGGYPDESLSYIPLLWMMDELDDDVDFLETFVRRARDLANPLGPIHDSRAGVGAYYRYQPRKIAAFIVPPNGDKISPFEFLKEHWPGWKTAFRHPGSLGPFFGALGQHPAMLLRSLRSTRTSLDRTASLRQPVPGGQPDWTGLLRSVCVHESVFTRIILGIDNYAPSALPAQFEIVRAPVDGKAIALLTPENDKVLDKTDGEKDRRFDHQENAWNLVWWRRVIYFTTIGATIALLVAPWSATLKAMDRLCSDDRCFARSILDIFLFFVPQGIRNSLDPWTKVPLAVLFLGLLIFVLIVFGRRKERQFRDRVRDIWRAYLAEPDADYAPIKKRSRRGRRIRESLRYQGVIFIVKWSLLPAICGLATLATLLYVAAAVATQAIFARAETLNTFCTPLWPSGAAAPIENAYFDTSAPCTDMVVNLTGGKPYRLTIKAIPAKPMRGDPKETTSPWFDRNVPADPRRGVTDRHMLMIVAAPFKRVTSANWMQVITEVRDLDANTWGRRLTTPGFGVDLRKQELRFVGKQTYETIFCPRESGRLFLMVNDAAPLLWTGPYANNRGTARVTLREAGDKKCT